VIDPRPKYCTVRLDLRGGLRDELVNPLNRDDLRQVGTVLLQVLDPSGQLTRSSA